MNFRKTLLALSVLGATAGLGLSGCGGSSHKHPETSAVLEATEALEAALVDAAKSGTVVTVADGYATGCAVTSGTLTAQEITTTIGQYLFLGDPAAALSAVGCTDAHTGISLPTLSAPIPTGTTGLDAVNLTPITTITQAFVAAGSSIADARTATTTLTGVVAADLDKDPVATPAIQQAVAKVVAIAKIVAAANSAVTDPIAAIVGAADTGNAALDTLEEVTSDVTAMTAVVGAGSANDVTTIAASVVTAVDGATGDTIAQITAAAEDLSAGDDVLVAAATETLDATGVETTEVTSTTVEAVAETIVEAIVVAVVAGTTDLSTISTDESVTDAAGDLEDAVTDTGGDFGGTGGSGGTSGI